MKMVLWLVLILGQLILSQEPTEPIPADTPLGKIAQLKKEITSIPNLLEILDQSPDKATTEAAVAFIFELDPKQPAVLSAFLKLAFHEKQEVAEATKIQKLKEEWLLALRDQLKIGTLEEKNKIALLLVAQGLQEVSTFLELLQSSDIEDQKIAKEQLQQLSKISPPFVISRLLELGEIDPNPVLGQNIGILLQNIGQHNSAALLSVLKDLSTEYSRNVVIQILEGFGKAIVGPALEQLRSNPDPEVQKVLKTLFKKLGVKIVPDILPFMEEHQALMQNLLEETMKSFGTAALPELIPILQDGTMEQQKVALRAIAVLGTDAREAFPVIKTFITRRNELQYQSLIALENMGDVSKAAVEELTSVFRTATRDYLIRSAAADCLANAGPAAVIALPLFRERLKLENDEFRETYPEVRRSICHAIGNMGNQAIPAIPQLVTCLVKENDETVVRAAAEAIGKIAAATEGTVREFQEAVEPLIRIFSSYGAKEIQTAAQALGNIAKSSSSVTYRLTRSLRLHDEPMVRVGIATAFKSMGKAGQPAVSSLILSLKLDSNDIVRQEVAAALGEIGASVDAIRALIEAARDESFLVRSAVAKALARMGPTIIPHVLAAIRKFPQEEARITFVQALGYLGPEAFPTLQDMLRYLTYWTGPAQKEVIRTLGQIGPQADPAIPALIELLKKSEDEELHQLVQQTLVQFGPNSIGPVLELLKEKSKLAQQSAIFVLDKLSEVAMPSLLKLLDSDDPMLVAQLIPIVGKTSSTLDELLRKLSHPNESVKDALVQTISRMGQIAIPKLVQIIVGSSDVEVCNTCRKTLVKIGEPTVPYILTALKDNPKPLAKTTFVMALGELGPKAQKAILILLGYLTSWQGKDRELVAESIGKIGVAAIPYLLRLLSNEDKAIQEAAILALEQTKSPVAIEYMLKSLKSPRWLPRVIQGIVNMKQVAVPVLTNSLNDPNEHIRFACAAALMEIMDKKAKDALLQQEKIEINPMVRYMLQKAIEASK